MVNSVYTEGMIRSKPVWFILLFLVFVTGACRIVSSPMESAVIQTMTPSLKTVREQTTASVQVVLTNTPQSFPSNLQGWFVGKWQQVSSGETYQFTDEFQVIKLGSDNQVMGFYRFTAESELLMPWGGELVPVEIWQLDQNSLLINFPNDVGIKFVRVSP